MPPENLHLTVLEIAHSQTPDEISKLVQIMESKIPSITEYTLRHRARLVKPMLSYDAAAIALSFLPAAGEASFRDIDVNSSDAYTYHHLRRDIYAQCKSAGVEVASRYVVPSSHLTIARFINQKDFSQDREESIDHSKIEKLVLKLEETNKRLHAEQWSTRTGEWQVGEEKGLVCRRGTVWYGGGESQHEGRGFDL